MKQLLLLLFYLLIVNLIHAQRTFDYNNRLSYIEGIQTIDGSEIDKNTRFATLESDKMIFKNRSSITFVNCLVKIDGLVDTSTNCRLRLINSYIICKNYKGTRTDRIIETDYVDNCKVKNLEYVKKIKGNPNIEIIDQKGSVVLKGLKEDISNSTILTGIYDIRSKGNFYESNVLLAGD